MSRTILGSTSIMLSATFACAPSDARPDAPATTVRDSAGIRIVESVGSPSNDSPWHLASQPAVKIGESNTNEESQLFGVVDATRLSDGRIVVANGGSSELRVFDSSGVFVDAVGGAGQGPGEFRGLTWVQRMADDTIAVWDRGNQRLSLFTAAGDLAFETGFEPIPDREQPAEPVGVVSAGVIVVTPRQVPAVRELREPMAFWLYGLDGDPRRLLVKTRGVQNFEFEWGTQSGPLLDHLPFGPWPGYTVDGARALIATGDARQIRLISASGSADALWRHDMPLPELSDSIVDAFEATVMDGAPDDLQGQAAWRGWFDQVPYPERASVYGRLIVGQDGTLWASDLTMPTFEPEHWWLFDSTGQLFGIVQVPERFHPFDAGDGWVLGKWTDEMDVEHVQMYEVLRDGD